MSDKSRFVLSGSNVVLAAGVIAIGAVSYGVWMQQSDDPATAEVASPDIAKPTEVVPLEDSEATPKADPQTAAISDDKPVVIEEENEQANISEPTPPTEPATEEVAVLSSDVSSEEEEEVVAPAASDESATDNTDKSTEPEPPLIRAPKFDVVRIDPLGSAVIAGSAEPGASVALLVDGDLIADAVADRNGKFVALFDLPPSETPRSLSAQLETAAGETVLSNAAVLIAPVKPAQIAAVEPQETATLEGDEPEAESPVVEPETSVDVAEAETDADIVTEAVDPEEVVVATAPEVEEQTVQLASPAPEEDAAPESPAIVLADETGVKVLQPAPRPAVPEQSGLSVVANLVIDTITYDQEGEVALAGRGAGASFARVYLNDKAIQTVKIAPDGTWRTPLPDVDAGVYRLRIDEVTAEGDVTSRVETPFQREEPEVAAISIQRPNAITVQKGFTLWAIAKDRFGEGTEYVRVYEANRDLIRDPDLIYPGQVFELPEN